MSRSTPCLSRVTSPTTSDEITIELFQVGLCSVVDTTYLGIAFILAANPTSSSMVGHALAKPS